MTSLGFAKKQLGFTMIELLVSLAIIAILSAVTIPIVLGWMPDYRLKKATRDLYNNMQLAKKMAITNGNNCAIIFNPGVPPNAGSYFICSDRGVNNVWDGPPLMGGDDTMVKMVELQSYDKNNNVDYGFANATDDVQGGGAPPAGTITYGGAPLRAVFNPRGTADVPDQGGIAEGYVYMENNRATPVFNRTTIAVGGLASGVIRVRKWFPQPGAWQ